MTISTKKIITIVLSIIIALVSFTVVAPRVSEPEFHENTIKALDESQDKVTGLTLAGIGASTAIAAVPGDATSPVADKIMDMTGYLFAILCVITMEKYMLTMSGLLAFKVMIPAACGFLMLHALTRIDLAKAAAVRFCAFAIMIFLLVPSSVVVSGVVTDTYEKSREYSTEMMQEELEEIESEMLADDSKGIFDKFTNKFAAKKDEIITKMENAVSTFMESIAVLMIVNIAIPIFTLLAFIWIIKLFFGLSGPVKLPRFSASKHIRAAQRKLKNPSDNIPIS